MNELPSRDAFFACLDTPFHLDEPGLGVELLLAQVSELKATREAQTFSIIFHGPADCLMPQRIYRLAHPRLGEFDLFLVPIGAQGNRVMYEAVFNQMLI
jgi:hypothetical protein